MSLLDDAAWLARHGKRFNREKHIAWSHAYADAQAKRVADEVRRGVGCSSSFDAEFFVKADEVLDEDAFLQVAELEKAKV